MSIVSNRKIVIVKIVDNLKKKSHNCGSNDGKASFIHVLNGDRTHLKIIQYFDLSPTITNTIRHDQRKKSSVFKEHCQGKGTYDFAKERKYSTSKTICKGTKINQLKNKAKQGAFGKHVHKRGQSSRFHIQIHAITT